MTYKKRPIDESDLEAVFLLAQQKLISQWSQARLAADLKRSETCALGLFTTDEKLIGYVWGAACPPEAELHAIVVADGYENQGVGKALLADFVKACQTKKCEDVYLEVATTNKVAKKLYTGFGFVKKGIRRAYYTAKDKKIDAEVFFLSI